MKSRFSRLAALCMAALLLPAGAALGQEKPIEPPPDPGIPPADKKDPPKDPRKPGGRIRMGEGPSDESPTETPPKDEKPAEKPAKSEPEQWVEILGKWPASEAKQASIRLASQPAAAWPLLLARLEDPAEDWRRVCGAAATLGKMGDARALDPIAAKLQDRRLYTHAADLLDALIRIDPAGAKSRLLAQLLHPSSAVVTEAMTRLLPRVGQPDSPAIRDVLEAGGPAARAAAVELLVKADPTSARASLIGALRDVAPDVSYAAARALASDDAPETEQLLLRTTLAPVDRQVAYAALALAFRGEHTGRRTVDDATVRLLLGGRGIQSVDPLARAAAACVLADVGYYHDATLVDDALDRRIVPELIDVVVGRNFWADLRLFQPLAQRRLQRLTGRSAATTAQEWVGWWQQAGPSFRARRVLLEIPEDQIGTLCVTLRGSRAPGGESTTFAASPTGLVFASPDDFVVLLGADDATRIAHAINESQVLRGGEAGIEGLAPLEMVVRAGRRERRVAFSAHAVDGAIQKTIAAAEALRRSYGWQRYRTQAQALDLPSFVELAGPSFAEEKSAAEKSAALAELITAALDDARGEAWNVRALGELGAVPNLGASLGDEGTRRLLGILGRRETLDRTAEEVVLVLAKAARPEAHPHVLDFLLTRESPRSSDLLTEVFRHADAASLAAGLADERVPVRRAAVAGLDESSPRDLAEAAVKKALGDPDVGVRREAVRALGRLHCEWARADVEKMASTPGDLQGAAVEALGRLGGKTALPALMAAFSADDPGLRIVAIEALGATREPEAFSAIAIAMSLDPTAMVREVASRVLVSLGTERATAELRRLALDRGSPAGPRTRALTGLVALSGREAARDLARLVEDPADEVADEAAAELARWRDPAAVPRLLKMLESGRRARVVRLALEGISLESFAQEDPALAASLYAGWWETSRERGPRGWLVDALVLAGIDEPVLRDWEAGRATKQVTPVLLKGIRTGGWAIRRACDLALRDISQRSVGEIEPFTPATELARIAAAWDEWWVGQEAAEAVR